MTSISTKPLTRKQKALFVKHFPLVRKIVNSMRKKLPSYADLDELISVGVYGLADAISKFDPSREQKFSAYASTRIRGSIIDELRDLDYMSRSARNDSKNVEKLREELEQSLGRKPNDAELRNRMGVSQKQFDKIMRRTQTFSFVSINEPLQNGDSDSASGGISRSIADENSPSAKEELEKKEMAQNLRTRMSELPERQRTVLQRYYFDEKKLGEIAKEFGLTEARICQIHAQALSSLRPKFVN